jgi:hypothetical protein
MALPDSKDGSAGDHKQDLSTILNTEEHVELSLLIANIAEIMRKQVADTFDATIVSGKQHQKVLQVTEKNPNLDDQPEKETEEEEKARKLREKREKELSAPKMLELKKDSLDFFDKWRESVDSRVGQVVNTPKAVAEEQKEKASVDATPEVAPPEPKILRKPQFSFRGLI